MGLAATPDSGSLRGDIREALVATMAWMTHPRFSRILPDLAVEGMRNPALNDAVQAAIGEPRRLLGAAPLHRAIERGELPVDTDIDLALDLLAAPIYWRLTVRRAHADPGYIDTLTTAVLRALGADATG